MESLSATKKMAIIRHYLDGLSYSTIAGQDRVSTGTVANVIAELKAGKFPEVGDVGEQLEQLRELTSELKKSKLSPVQCAVGLSVLAFIHKYGLEPADIDRWSLILKAVGSDKQAQEFVRLVYSIQGVQQKTGLSLEELDNKVHDMEKKAADMEPMVKRFDEHQQRVNNLTKQRENLTGEVNGLQQKYNQLNTHVKDLETQDHDLLQRIKYSKTTALNIEANIATLTRDKQDLANAGLSLESLTEFNQKVKLIAERYQIKPAEMRERLFQELIKLDQGLGLESLIQNRKADLEDLIQVIATSEQESKNLKAIITSLKQEKANLEANIKESTEKVSREIEKIMPIAKNTIIQSLETLRRGHDEVLTEIRQLKDETIEVGKEIGRYEGILQTNQWLSELLSLVRGEEAIDSKRVRVITLTVLRGTAAWLKNSKADKFDTARISLILNNLIEELEKWKA